MDNYNIGHASGPEAVKQYSTAQLRGEFLIQDLFKKDDVCWVYSHYDRFMVAGVIPIGKS